MSADDNLQTAEVPDAVLGTQADLEQIAAKDPATKIKFFGTMAVPCLIFAVVFVFCMFRNIGGVTAPIWIASVIGLIAYSLKKYEKPLKKDSCFVMAIMVLISISSFLTGSEDIQILNILALFMLTVHLVLLNYADTSKWNLDKHVGEMIVAVFGSIGYLLTPFTEASAYAKANSKDDAEAGSEGTRHKKGNGKQILIGAIIAIPCLVILGALLGSADMVFDSMLSNIFDKIKMPENFFGILFMAVFGFFSAYCGLHYAVSRGDRITVSDRRNSEPVIAITVNAPIAVMYLVFSVIQILYLFIGNFELPEGATYAQYAREGFFQLLFVCIINMLLVLAMKAYIRRSRVLDIILIVICACTYIMIASSACRMIMYIEAYELTLLRVIVLFALTALAFLMGGVVASIINEKFRFFRYGLVVVCVVYCLFAFSRPDTYIARYNLTSAGSEKKVMANTDFYYISNLSTDAAPVIDEYLRENGINPFERSESGWYTEDDGQPAWLNRYIMSIEQSMENTEHLRKLNLSEHRAAALGWTK